MQEKIFWSQDECQENYIKNHHGDIITSKNDGSITLFISSQMENEINYENVFCLDAQSVCGIVFPQKWIKECGGINGKLPAGHIYDFLCRLLEKTGKCNVVSIYREDTLLWSEEDYAFLYAYVFCYHIGTLQRRKLTDTVLLNMCELMNNKKSLQLFRSYLNYFLGNEKDFYSIANVTAPFLVLKGDDTCYGVLQKFAEDLADGLIRQEQAVIMVGEDLKIYDELPNYFYKGIVGFQTRALEIDFFQKLHGPKFQFWMDYPLHFQDILRDLPEDNYVLCQDADYAKLIRDYFHTKNAIQFPPGGVTPREVVDFDGDRPYDIAFVGSYFRDERKDLSEPQIKFYHFMIQHPNYTFEKGLREMIEIPEENSYNEAFIEKMQELKPACRSVIGYFREKVIRTILAAGYSVHVYGDGWEMFDSEHCERLIIHKSVLAEESLEEFKKAKIGLNIMSWHKAGMTERIANIMLAGAVCLSDETTFLRENTIDGEEIVLFRLNEINKIPHQIKHLLEDEGYRRRIAGMGYEKALREYSWDARARQLISIAEME